MIVKVPDPLLRTISMPVSSVDRMTRDTMDEMLEAMYAAPGIGLSAVQIGVPERIVVIDLSPDGERNPPFFVNPRIKWASEEMAEHEEGCLSMPGVFGMVSRPALVKVAYLDQDGEAREHYCTDLLACVIQHEIDHLNGVLFTDRMTAAPPPPTPMQG